MSNSPTKVCGVCKHGCSNRKHGGRVPFYKSTNGSDYVSVSKRHLFHPRNFPCFRAARTQVTADWDLDN